MNKACVCGKRNSYVISQPFVLFNDKEQPNIEELNGGLKQQQQQQNEVTTTLKAKHKLNMRKRWRNNPLLHDKTLYNTL